MCISEYNEKVFISGIREEGREEGIKQGIEQGIKQGIEEGIKNLIIFAKNTTNSQEIACENLQKMYELSYDEAMEKVEKYWND